MGFAPSGYSWLAGREIASTVEARCNTVPVSQRENDPSAEARWCRHLNLEEGAERSTDTELREACQRGVTREPSCRQEWPFLPGEGSVGGGGWILGSCVSIRYTGLS
jgi:hypothetical protein